MLSAPTSPFMVAPELTFINLADDPQARDSNDNMMAWQWALIGLAIACTMGLLLFFLNWFKHRPQSGDNRQEVVQSLEQSRLPITESVDVAPIALSANQARFESSKYANLAPKTMHSFNTILSQVSSSTDGSYRTNIGKKMSSTLTDTEIVAQHQERMFSPLSDSTCSRSSDYLQSTEANKVNNDARVQDSSSDLDVRSSSSSYSAASDMISELKSGDFDLGIRKFARILHKKSTEF
ncbi:hypothetical protein CCR75_003031 [Bremia lactucae]|uniref:Uncharacterized protein n=1 Tax=Bremia lactucae TaxID=4779 RepID=A0A976NZY8_BRELC|nr:hypothetical protein CCR75_003031 [Bremia lactucae]